MFFTCALRLCSFIFLNVASTGNELRHDETGLLFLSTDIYRFFRINVIFNLTNC